MRHGAILQELIAPHGYDLRVLVAGGAAVGAIKRIAASGDWRTNISLGGSKRPCAPSSTASALAEAAAAAIGADLVGVDLLPSDKGYVVVEATAPSSSTATTLPGADVYTDVADALGLFVRRHRVAEQEDLRISDRTVSTGSPAAFAG